MSLDSSVSSLDRFLFKMDENSSETPPAASDEQTDGSCESVLKRCSKCQLEYSLDEFWVDRHKKDGLHSYCKTCFKNYVTDKKRRRESTDACDETCDVALDPCDTPDSLYIMENPRIPGEIKIGRSHSPEDRAKQISSGNNFRLLVKYSYGGKGFLEKTLHHKLKLLRVEGAASIEWFKLTTEQADLLIRATVLEHELGV